MASDLNDVSVTVTHGPTISRSLVGTTVNGRYYIERELKRGGFGIVFLARDKELHSRRVVLKILLEDAYRNAYVVQKFLQEVEALSRLDHPGVVGIVGAGELPDGQPFIVMQYVDGTTLRAHIDAIGMPFNTVASVMRQMGRALSAAHDKGILHRDLKPENVMLQNLGHDELQVKIIDFGISKIQDSAVPSASTTSVSPGTVSYMAPEQLSGKPVSVKTDVYALAEIAYEMLTGSKPFNPETSFALLEMQRAGVSVRPAHLRPGIPDAAQQLILRALEFDPDARPQSAREFGDALASLLCESDVSAPAATQLAVNLPAPNTTSQEKTVAATFPIGPTTPERLVTDAEREVGVGRHKTRTLWFGLGVVVLSAAVLAVSLYIYERRTGKAPAAIAGPAVATGRGFNYWLTVQKMRDGKPYQDAFESSGQEIFENGWKFILNFQSQNQGYLYLLNEGPAENDLTTYNVLFPDPNVNSGASMVEQNQQIKTGWMLFDEHQGTEKFWIVWAATPVTELEAVRSVVNEKDHGAINSAEQMAAVRNFLYAHLSAEKLEIVKNKSAKQTTINGSGAIVVTFVELEHH